MSRVPGRVTAAMTVMMTDRSIAFAVSVTGPVTARMIAFLPREKGRAIVLGASQNIVLVRLVATAFDLIAIFVDRGSLDQVRAEMQLIEIAGDQIAPGIVPRSLTDPVTSGLAPPFRYLRGKIGTPCTAFGASRLGELCAMGIATRDAAKIAAIADADASDEKSHAVITGLCQWTAEQYSQPRSGPNRGDSFCHIHHEFFSLLPRNVFQTQREG